MRSRSVARHARILLAGRRAVRLLLLWRAVRLLLLLWRAVRLLLWRAVRLLLWRAVRLLLWRAVRLLTIALTAKSARLHSGRVSASGRSAATPAEGPSTAPNHARSRRAFGSPMPLSRGQQLGPP